MEVFESLRWTLVGMYLCIVGGICLLLGFMYTFIAHSLTNDVKRGVHHVSFFLVEFSMSRSVFGYAFRPL
jgi:hypothetical protein